MRLKTKKITRRKGETKLEIFCSRYHQVTKLKYFLKKNQPISIAETITFFRLVNLQKSFGTSRLVEWC